MNFVPSAEISSPVFPSVSIRCAHPVSLIAATGAASSSINFASRAVWSGLIGTVSARRVHREHVRSHVGQIVHQKPDPFVGGFEIDQTTGKLSDTCGVGALREVAGIEIDSNGLRGSADSIRQHLEDGFWNNRKIVRLIHPNQGVAIRIAARPVTSPCSTRSWRAAAPAISAVSVTSGQTSPRAQSSRDSITSCRVA